MSARLFPARRVMWMPLDHDWQPPSPAARHCCGEMAAALEMSCDLHTDPFDCPDVSLVFHELFAEYGIPIRDGGAGYLLISNCPFCGTALPASRRDDWFDAVEAENLADTPFDTLPERFRTAQWRTT
ncbi:MAG: hypothetical protein R3D27_11840 [Hyphomicrobiaceae bacterium]